MELRCRKDVLFAEVLSRQSLDRIMALVIGFGGGL